ncbi:BspA family leucine-rich repeat surface protein [Flagellimonas hadalis]|uniref:BspA family leucine-rich repeat surface protein n=1 Tax=Flagellimonas hadalis TaxID=2597517 RepID=A0A5N5IV28_9FLAO|nr:BspA family leucine-rich repeat surface protein [Allomuricauda hadalis]KAB5491635.1 BspA family leucine-rich repeat surface protein [Allomuricauda hadalis]
MKHIIKKLGIALFAMALLWSCGKDDGPTTPPPPDPQDQNTAPVMAAQEFSAKEDITPADAIGTVAATDADNDALTFSIKANDNALFSISSAGALTLAASKALDFETKTQHSITVSVSDGTETTDATITIKVEDVDEVVPTENTAPEISDQEFTVLVGEEIPDAITIGTVEATDADGDELTFTILNDADGLFEINPTTGEISLKSLKAADFVSKVQHNITVEVSDGKDKASASVTIKVEQNSAPEIMDQEFTVAEDINDTEVIGTVEATDADGNGLTFALVTDLDNLFEVDATTGNLSLIAGKTLDFEKKTQHSITVSVTDGMDTVPATITINVTDKEENLSNDPNAFITTWKTDADNEEIVIGTNNSYDYNYTIYWGDGTSEQITTSDPISHIYASAGTHTVSIVGVFPAIRYINGVTTSSKLMSIEQWGTIAWRTMQNAFAYCINMVYNATDTPDLSQVTSMSYMFLRAEAFNGAIGDWDTSNVTDMTGLFRRAIAFNQDIGNWDTSNVTSMSSVFLDANSFNQNIGNWNIGSVITMTGMFDNSGMSVPSFNATIVAWNAFVEQNGGPSGITIGVDGVPSCPGTAAARSNLINMWNWTFQGNVQYHPNCN